LFWFHPIDDVFGRFDLAALRGCHTLNMFVCLSACAAVEGADKYLDVFVFIRTKKVRVLLPKAQAASFAWLFCLRWVLFE
jgi:hypothetical protein